MSSKDNTIRVAIPSMYPGGLNAPRSGHFGHCDCFTLVDMEDGRPTRVEVVENPPHVEGGCLAPVNLLASHGVKVLVVQGMGMRPLVGFMDVGINVFLGEGAQVQQSLDAFAQGRLQAMSPTDTCGGGH